MTEPTDKDTGDALPADAEEAMHPHRPKPLHGPREILTEIGVIVIGIAIALLGEQAVEAVHWSHKVDEAERSMRLELSRDDGAQAFARIAIGRCLDGVSSTPSSPPLSQPGAIRSEVICLTDAYQPPQRTWDRQTWESATASDIGSHMGAERLSRWGSVFELTFKLNAESAREAAGVDLLSNASAAKGPLSTQDADRTLRAVKALRRTNARMEGASTLMLRRLKTGKRRAVAGSAQPDLLAGRSSQSYAGFCARVPEPEVAANGDLVSH